LRQRHRPLPREIGYRDESAGRAAGDLLGAAEGAVRVVDHREHEAPVEHVEVSDVVDQARAVSDLI
jgi:hypothetical protein